MRETTEKQGRDLARKDKIAAAIGSFVAALTVVCMAIFGVVLAGLVGKMLAEIFLFGWNLI